MFVAAYAGLSLLVLAYLLWCCEDFRLIYLLLGAVLLVMVVVLPFGDIRTALLGALLLLTLVVPALRMLGRDLRALGERLGAARLGVLALRSLVLWLPIGLLVLGGIALISWRNALVRAQVYDIEVPARWTGPCARLVCEDDARDMRLNLHAATDRVAFATRAAVGERLGTALDGVNTAGVGAGQAVQFALFDPREGVFPESFEDFSGITIPGCVWPLAIVWPAEMTNCMRRTVLQPMDSAYRTLRDDLQNEISSHADSLAARLEADSEALDREIMGALERDLDRYAATAKSHINRAFQLGWMSAIVWWLSLSILLSKAYLLILARFVFGSRSGAVPLSLSGTERDGLAFNGEDITRTDGSYGYRTPLHGRTWYGCFGRGVRPDEHGRPSFPMLSRLFFARLASSRLRMQRFDPDQFDHIGGQANHSARFVRIDLNEGDRLCFHLASLAAFSEGIALRSVLNLRLAAMLQHRLFFPVASGAGSVVLRIDGGSVRIMPQDRPEGADPMDMAAFDMDGCFSLRAQHDFLSVYTEGYTVVPDERTFVIRHAPDRLSSQGGKMLRKVLFFVLPV